MLKFTEGISHGIEMFKATVSPPKKHFIVLYQGLQEVKDLNLLEQLLHIFKSRAVCTPRINLLFKVNWK